MNIEFKRLIASGESGTVEFKESFGKGAVETMAAFANSEGGFLCVGVEDKGSLIGVDVSEETIWASLGTSVPGDAMTEKSGGDGVITPPITPPITGVEMRILRLLKNAPTASSGDLAKQLSIGRDTVKEYLGRLKAKKLLIREGSPRSGRWIVSDVPELFDER